MLSAAEVSWFRYNYQLNKFTTMKKLFYFFPLLLAASLVFISCSGDDDDIDPTVTDTGVMIGGARWATRNVGAPGTFVANPQDAGMLFQWNRQRGWTVGSTTGWDGTNAEGTEWAAENDPCPPGWRVPTYGEVRTLSLATGGRWDTENGVEGRWFGRAPNQIFLPAVGSIPQIVDQDGNMRGTYWSSTENDSNTAHTLSFSSRAPGRGIAPRLIAFPIRCVAKNL